MGGREGKESNSGWLKLLGGKGWEKVWSVRITGKTDLCTAGAPKTM